MKFQPRRTGLKNESGRPERITHRSAARTSVADEHTGKGSRCVLIIRANDPSAGSPTETLLRLLLPLGDKVH